MSCFMQDLDFGSVLRLLQRRPGKARLPNLTAALMGFSHPAPLGGCENPTLSSISCYVHNVHTPML